MWDPLITASGTGRLYKTRWPRPVSGSSASTTDARETAHGGHRSGNPALHAFESRLDRREIRRVVAHRSSWGAGIVAPVHPKAMSVILTMPAEVDRWLEADTPDALALQQPLAMSACGRRDSDEAVGWLDADYCQYLHDRPGRDPTWGFGVSASSTAMRRLYSATLAAMIAARGRAAVIVRGLRPCAGLREWGRAGRDTSGRRPVPSRRLRGGRRCRPG
jgi:hypothetical protein